MYEADETLYDDLLQLFPLEVLFAWRVYLPKAFSPMGGHVFAHDGTEAEDWGRASDGTTGYVDIAAGDYLLVWADGVDEAL